MNYRQFKNKKMSGFKLNNCDISNINRWVIKYENNEVEGLKEIIYRSTFSSEIVINAIKDYLNKEGPVINIVKKYNLGSDATIKSWLK